MMGTRPVREPAELIIWSASSLLGVMVGLGAAFIFWSLFRRSPDAALVNAAVTAVALGLALVAVAIDKLAPRLFIWAGCATLLIAFFVGSGFFVALAG